jgi:hypothetical protein
VSDRVPDVGILDLVPSGTGVDAKLTHLNIVLQKYRPGKGSAQSSRPAAVGSAVHWPCQSQIGSTTMRDVALLPDTCWSARAFEWVAPGSNREPTD